MSSIVIEPQLFDSILTDPGELEEQKGVRLRITEPPELARCLGAEGKPFDPVLGAALLSQRSHVDRMHYPADAQEETAQVSDV